MGDKEDKNAVIPQQLKWAKEIKQNMLDHPRETEESPIKEWWKEQQRIKRNKLMRGF